MATQLNKSMVSETSIANQALGWLGANHITSLDEDSVAAQLMRDNYPFIRDAVLTEVAWTFATDQFVSDTADKDEWGVMFKHPLPVDWLQVLRVYRDVSRSCKITSTGWNRQGNFVLADEAKIYGWGIKRITDTALFHPAFVQCLAARLAADLCMSLTENTRQQAVLWQMYGIKLTEAANSDGVQGAAEKIQSNNLIDARASGGYGG